MQLSRSPLLSDSIHFQLHSTRGAHFLNEIIFFAVCVCVCFANAFLLSYKLCFCFSFLPFHSNASQCDTLWGAMRAGILAILLVSASPNCANHFFFVLFFSLQNYLCWSTKNRRKKRNIERRVFDSMNPKLDLPELSKPQSFFSKTILALQL